jgi:molybdopterin molybdotransferase
VSTSSPNIVLSYPEASEVVLQHARSLGRTPPAIETVPLLDSLERILAEPIVADRDQPPFSRSTRDGFACRAADLDPPHPLRIAGQLRSGQVWSEPVPQSGQALEIMTGAPVPDGLDCVVMIEHVIVEGDFVRPASDRRWTSGENIVPKGAEARSGGTLLLPGTRMQPQHLAIAAACGLERLNVYKRPRVAILSTGDELVSFGKTPLSHQIRNSNSYSLAAQVTRAGGEPIVLSPAPDRQSAIEASIRNARACDLILLSGGVSMGKYDFVEQALASLKAEFFFTGARIQPGRPVVFGRIPEEGGHRYFFGLPGNPVSTMVTFALFAAPLLGFLSGKSAEACKPDFREAHLEAAIEGKAGLTRFLPARSTSDIDGVRVRLRPWQGSGDIAAASESNCFLVCPDQGEALAESDRVTVLHL